MYPNIPFGPASLPTLPFLALIGGWLGLGVFARAGRRLGLSEDRMWNLGVVMVAAGLIVARIAHVVQFWPVYRADPWLMVSIRPGGLLFGPGLVAAVLAGYAYMLLHRMDPLRVMAALSIGLLVAGTFLDVGAFLSGDLVGTPTTLPWGMDYFGETRHPVGFYRAGAMLALAAILWRWGDARRPGRFLLQALLGYGLIRLVVDGFVANAETVAGLRIGQVMGFVVALVASLLLARTGAGSRPASDPAYASPE